MDQRLSGQRAALERGQNPLPLYLSLSVKENNLETLDFKGTVLRPVHPTPNRHMSVYTQTCTQIHACTPTLHPVGPQEIQTGNRCVDGRGAVLGG